MSPPVILFDYDFSPYGQKLRTYLTAAKIPYLRCEQPFLLPRPTLESLGVTYRRIPVLAIGKDFYCDSAKLIVALQHAYRSLPTNPADRAFEAFGNAIFVAAVGTIDPRLFTDDFKKDRVAFSRKSRPKHVFIHQLATVFITVGESCALGEFRANLDIIEKNFLQDHEGPLGGPLLSLADIHLACIVRWVLEVLQVGKEPGFGKDDIPKIDQWIESLPADRGEIVPGEEATKTILHSEHSGAEPQIAEGCPLGLEKGTAVCVESADTAPGAYPQNGKLVGTGMDEVVIELDNRLRMHFPRRGYAIRKQ